MIIKNKKEVGKIINFLMERWETQSQRAMNAESLLFDLTRMSFIKYLMSRKKIVNYLNSLDCKGYEKIMWFLKGEE